MEPVLQARAASMEPGQDEAMAIAVSSTQPVERWHPDHGRFYEVLDHGRAALDLDRLNARGLPLRVTESVGSHDPGMQVGRVAAFTLDADGKLRGLARFSRSAKAQEIRQDVLDGIRGDVSIGYRVMQYQRAGEQDGVPVYRATRWMPYEATLLPVPADETVGVGRAADPPTAPVSTSERDDGTTPQERMMPETTDTPPAPVVVPVADHGQRAKEAAEIARLCTAFNMGERAAEFLESGKTLGQVKAEILDGMRAKPLPIQRPVEEDLTPKERERYSLRAAILALASGRREGLEYEVSQELAKRMNRETAGLYVPTTMPIVPTPRAERTTHIVGTATLGGNAVFTEPGSFIEVFRNRARVIQLGARSLTGLQGNVAFPRQATSQTATWNTETGTVAESNLTLNQLSLSPNTLQVTNSYSRQLLVQSTVDVEMMLRTDIAAAHALALDLAVINGSGTNQPQGLISMSGVGLVTLGANGAAIDYASIVSLETTVSTSNADVATMAFLTSAKQRGRLRTTAEFTATNGVPVWRQGASDPFGFGEVLGYRAATSQQVPDNLTKGTSTTVCSAIIFGNWEEVMIGEWGALELIADPYTGATTNTVKLTSVQFVDADVRHAASFAVIRDAL